jgi:hypothetical protein
MLADATWQNISWRTGTKGKLKARFAAIRVRIADGPPQRIRDKGQQHRSSRLCQPCATPSSNSSLDHHRSDVRIAENGFATSRA